MSWTMSTRRPTSTWIVSVAGGLLSEPELPVLARRLSPPSLPSGMPADGWPLPSKGAATGGLKELTP